MHICEKEIVQNYLCGTPYGRQNFFIEKYKTGVPLIWVGNHGDHLNS